MIYLASGSPRRRELLEQIGIDHTRLHVDMPEQQTPGEAAEDYVTRLALAKARAGWQALSEHQPQWPVLGADTAVVIDHDILGKPHDQADAIAMLTRLAGREHRVLSAVAMVQGEHEAVRLSTTRVSFAPLSPTQCEAYWHSGEPQDKAGGYAIQGLAASFIRHIDGSYSGVMGLPLCETSELLQQFGIEVIRMTTQTATL